MIFEVTIEERKTLLVSSETEEDAIEMTADEFYEYMTLADQTTVSCIALPNFDPNDAPDDTRVWNLNEDADAKIMAKCFYCFKPHGDAERSTTEQVTDTIYNAMTDNTDDIKQNLTTYLEMAWLAMEGDSLDALDLSSEELDRLKRQLQRHLFIGNDDTEESDEE